MQLSAGVLMVATGSLLLASKGVFAKFLYARDVDFETVVAVRAMLAIPGFFLIAMLCDEFGRLRDAEPGDLMQAVMAGLICYYLGASANFYALTLMDASVERALLYSYPALVVVATWVVSGARPGRVTIASVIATYIGIALAVGLFSGGLVPENYEGPIWVLVCSGTIAYYFMISGKLTQTLGSAGFTFVAMSAAGIALAIQYQIRHGWANLHLDTASWALVAGLVAIATVLPLYLVAAGVRRIGAQRSAIASTAGPPAATILAVILLGETVTLGQLAGILLIVYGIASLEIRKSQRWQAAKPTIT